MPHLGLFSVATERLGPYNSRRTDWNTVPVLETRKSREESAYGNVLTVPSHARRWKGERKLKEKEGRRKGERKGEEGERDERRN